MTKLLPQRTVKQDAPALPVLYAKALLPQVGGETLPNTEYVRPDIDVDLAHLAAYDQVCGFRLTDELPATYPHMLIFRLQMALMTEKEFPFPLLGMVHVANRITQHRPLGLGETYTARVWAENLRSHASGRQFDVRGELSVGGRPVWTEVSTYLRRGGDEGPSRSGQLTPPAPTAIWRVSGDIGRRYAEVSGDRNPIHLHALTARLFGFPSAIAHGMWIKARALAAFEGRLPGAYTVDVRFKRPVPLPAKVGFTSWRTDEGWAFELWGTRKPRPHLEGSLRPPHLALDEVVEA
ncbi:MAG TPA: MaoC/PaaZ C-terminal domain-containing protein [Amycolatopsis sp.]|uniref:MaoC family dehydratase n=1 Tax=Amycolatopsis sp. TaxID=37632 RepID=UPI002B462BB5|nr:MaoC/PaaZ C-terminal domain-containing protein [Amycolatopsis sp.]HKS46284.1 MaoC/PaaZ C-terminal domain-containing protein [Amycolatopsis sp.]